VSPNNRPMLLLATGRDANKGEAAISRSRVSPMTEYQNKFMEHNSVKDLGMIYLAIDPDEWISRPLQSHLRPLVSPLSKEFP
jgi:hypothetical protein